MDLTLTAPGARLRLTGPFVPSPTPPRADGGVLDSEAAIGIAEESVVDVWLEGDASVSLRHPDPVVVAGLRSEAGGHIVVGQIALGSHVGRTQFQVTNADGPLATLHLDVVPVKASPQAVAAMRRDVELAWAGSVFAAVRPATLCADLDLAAERLDPAWLTVLDATLPRVARALETVARRPERAVARDPAPAPTAALTRVRPASAARVARRSGADPAAWPHRISAATPREHLETPALRWIAARLDAAAAHATALVASEAARVPSLRRRRLLDRLGAHRDRLHELRRHALLADTSGRAPATPPLALRRRPQHRRLYDAVRALDAGLNLADGDLRPALRDVATLYETWATLAVVHAAADALGEARPDVPLARAGADVALARGSSVQMRADSVAIRVQIQPRFADAPALLVQRPDVLLTVEGRTRGLRVVVDAKYRRDDSPRAHRRFGGPAPPADAIGALHRYRDAILSPDGQPGWVDAAVALFPSEQVSPRLRRSIDSLGVGAIPLVPGATEGLGDWLAALVRTVR